MLDETQKLKILSLLAKIVTFYQNFDQNVKILISLAKFEVRGQIFGPRDQNLRVGVDFGHFGSFWAILVVLASDPTQSLRALIEISLKSLPIAEGA